MASQAAEQYLATLPPEDQAAIRAGGDIDEWYKAAVASGGVPVAHGGQNTPENQARLDQQKGNDWQNDVAQDLYSQRDWSNATIKDIFDQQYQRLIGMGVAPNRARRIVSIALGGMEHDWQQYKNASREEILAHIEANGGADLTVDRFLWGDKGYDPKCPQETPYRAENGEGCVEKPWDTGYDPSKHKGEEAGGGEGGGGGGGGGKGGGAGAVGTVANAGANDLQRQLEAQYAAKGGIFSPANQPGIRLNEGGLLWTDQPASTAPLGSPAPAGGGGNGGNRPENQGNQPAAFPTSYQPGEAALMSATLNAFTPNAPSQKSAPQTTTPVQVSAPPPITQTPAPGNQALVNTTANQYTNAQNPNRGRNLKWWEGQQTA